MGQTTIPRYDNIPIKAGGNVAYVSVWNPGSNKVYFQFAITLKSNHKVLHKSGLVPPGDAVSMAKLSQKINKGVYPIVMEIDAFNLKDYQK